MNKKILLFLLMLIPLMASAQTKRTIHVATAGTLSNYISNEEKYQIEELTLTGELNGTDFRLIRDMAGVSSWMRSNGMIVYENTDGRLKTLDISNSAIVEGGSYYMEAEFTGPLCTDCSDLLYTQDNCISRQLFYKSKLESVIIPSNVTCIGEKAFGECSGLTSIVIPQSVKSIQSSAFMSCANLFSISVESGNLIYDSRNNCNAIIETESNTLIAGCRRTIIPTDVTSIGENAFSYCSSLTSLTLPNSVTSISNYAFYNCSGLTTIVSEIENPFVISDDVFNDFYNDLYSTATLIVPPGKKSAYQNTAGWKKFQNIVEAELMGYEFENNGIRYKIGENNTVSVVSRAGKYSGDVVIPSQVSYHGSNYSVTSIGGSAFEGCVDMTSVTIPSSVTSIGYQAFRDCSGLTSITIPNSVTSIGWYAFQNCSGLTSVTIPNSVTSIGSEAFKNTGWYNNQPDGLVYAGNVAYNYKGTMPNNTSIIIKDGTVGIADQAFRDCSGLTSITIPNSVTSIGGAAFSKCIGLTSITIPNSVTSIREHVFEYCSGLTSITIPSSVTSIGFSAFSECIGLTSITIPNSVTSIVDDAFIACNGLTSITIPNSVTSIGSFAFAIGSLTTIVSEIETPFAITDYVFSNYGTATLIVPPGKKSVYQNTAGWNKFTNIVEAELMGYEFENSGIRYKIGENNTVSVVSRDAKYSGDVVIPSQVSYHGSNYDVTAIGPSAFEGCVDMTSVTIPSSVTTIGGAAFYYCTGLTTVDIPNGVTTIGEGAFSKCEGLTSVTIPGSVTTIDSNAFFQCYALTQITSWIENPFVINSNVFPTSVYSNATLNVPSGKKTVYQNTTGWKKFVNISESSKCAKPTISYGNGKISFSCETEGVEFHYTISNTNSSTGVGSSVNFSPTVNISVYASKSGFANSDTSTTEIVVPAGLRGDLTGDGQVNVADHVELSKIILGQ